ncbi:MAG TPA: energy-coupling factor transporter transmembrane component T, partial [Nocardioides sp.]|nr:energy-coupling factor transporter transmembrane component T [Nocardioides sp.]
RAWPALASTAGALFIRSYERGERIHLAMLARGYNGRLPVTHRVTATRAQWAQAGILPALTLATAAAAVAL